MGPLIFGNPHRNMTCFGLFGGPGKDPIFQGFGELELLIKGLYRDSVLG